MYIVVFYLNKIDEESLEEGEFLVDAVKYLYTTELYNHVIYSAKITKTRYFMVKWRGFQRQPSIEPETMFKQHGQNYIPHETQQFLTSAQNCAGTWISFVGTTRNSARISEKNKRILENDKLTDHTIDVACNGSVVVADCTSTTPSQAIVLTGGKTWSDSSIPILFQNSGKGFCVLCAFLNMIDGNKVQYKELLKIMNGAKICGLNVLSGK